MMKKSILLALAATALSLSPKAQTHADSVSAKPDTPNEITIKPFEIRINPNASSPRTVTVRQGTPRNYTYKSKTFQPWQLLYINNKLVLGGHHYITDIEQLNTGDDKHLYFVYTMHTLTPVDKTGDVVTEETLMNGVVFDLDGNVIDVLKEDRKNFPQYYQQKEIYDLINKIQETQGK